MRRKAFATAFALLLVVANAARASDAEWGAYAGPTSTRWLTKGRHGHDQPSCPEQPNCDPSDFRRSNLDDSIGFRIGAQRGLFGIEANVAHTEYNLSQKNVNIFALQAFAGRTVPLGKFHFGMRAGAGPLVTSDGNAGAQASLEAFVALPHALQFGSRLVLDHTGAGTAKALETSFLIAPATRWNVATATGVTVPSGLNLRRAPFTRLSTEHGLTENARLVVSWTSSGHESQLKTSFRGYPGNERSKTINGFGLAVDRSAHVLSGGTGMEVAQWKDDHALLTDQNGVVNAGIEFALELHAAIRQRIGRRLALEGSIQQLYWPNLRLAETRIGVGIAFVTPGSTSNRR